MLRLLNARTHTAFSMHFSKAISSIYPTLRPVYINYRILSRLHQCVIKQLQEKSRAYGAKRAVLYPRHENADVSVVSGVVQFCCHWLLRHVCYMDYVIGCCVMYGAWTM